MLCVPKCLTCLYTNVSYVPICLTCLRAFVFLCLTCLLVFVPLYFTCLRACLPLSFTFLYTNVSISFTCLSYVSMRLCVLRAYLSVCSYSIMCLYSSGEQGFKLNVMYFWKGNNQHWPSTKICWIWSSKYESASNLLKACIKIG